MSERLHGTITIELRARSLGPPSGSKHVDLAHDAYWLRQHLPDMQLVDQRGKTRRLSEKYEVGRIDASTA